MNRVRVGCSGWNYDSWRGLLYPPGVGTPRWLELYAAEFDTIEVNSTFYRLASRPAVQRWVDSTPPGRNAFEFRHPTWFAPEVLDLLRDHGVALVLAHHPERPWQAWELTADFTFVRFHRGARGRGGNYSATELDEWAPRIGALARDADVFAYFNNDWKGFAPRNAMDLRKRIAAVCRPGAGEEET